VSGPVGGGVLRARDEEEKLARSPRTELNLGAASMDRAAREGLASILDDRAGECEHEVDVDRCV
jgi:hypothetical protein